LGAADVGGRRRGTAVLRLRPLGEVSVELFDVPPAREQAVREILPNADVVLRAGGSPASSGAAG
jgi:hypothetical protein